MIEGLDDTLEVIILLGLLVVSGFGVGYWWSRD